MQISPDQSRIISVGAEGAILFWNSPPELAKDLKSTGYVPKVRRLCPWPLDRTSALMLWKPSYLHTCTFVSCA